MENTRKREIRIFSSFTYKMGTSESRANFDEASLKQLAADTHFTEEEIRLLHGRFLQLSSTIVDDGKIDFNEFQQSLGIPNAEFAKRIFSAFDSDGSFDIDFIEFARGLYTLSSKASLEEKAKFCFGIYDIDKNGSIDRDELKEVLTLSLKQNKAVKLTDQQLQTIINSTFKRIDANNDNQISFEEFLSEAKKNPAILACVSLDSDRLFAK